MGYRGAYCGILWAILFCQGILSAAEDFNQKVASLDLAKAGIKEVVQIFGQPEQFFWGKEIFTEDKLPANYIARYNNGFSVAMSNGKIAELRFEGNDTGYRFEGKLGIGYSLEKTIDILGQPERIVENQKNEFADKVLYVDIDGQRGVCYYQLQDKHLRLFFADYRITGLYLINPAALRNEGRFQVEAIDTVKPYLDVRWKDLRNALKDSDKSMVRTFRYNNATLWPEFNIGNMPLKNYVNELLERAKNPGLGVRKLHQEGITGKGVTVAIIDQPLYLNHPEFEGKIIEYHDVGCESEKSSMHGPSVASLLVGTYCGTAPDAKLFYAAAPSWNKDAAFQARALDWLIEKNQQLPKGQKIRVVSVSAAPSGQGSPFETNTEQWDQACRRAEAVGIMILDCTEHHGFISPAYFRMSNVELPAGCEAGSPTSKWGGHITQTKIFVPTCPRTSAEQYTEDQKEYVYWGQGGLSWAIPYCAGVLAMGWQVDPDATPEQMKELLFESAYQNKQGAMIINPLQFIRTVQKNHIRMAGERIKNGK